MNVASGLESSGVPDRIQVSPQVAGRLAGRFAFEPRGEIEIKGVGAMTTYFLTASARP